MSLECSECERDLRGGHAIECSRYNLERGVADAILRAAGNDVDDEEFQPHPTVLKLAAAAIAHIRAYDAAQATHAAASHPLTPNLVDDQIGADLSGKPPEPNEQTIENALSEVDRLWPGGFWIMAKGRMRAAEPLFGFKVLFGADEVLSEGEGDTALEAICAACSKPGATNG